MENTKLTKIEWRYQSENSDILFLREEFVCLENVYSIINHILEFVLEKRGQGENAWFSIRLFEDEENHPRIYFGVPYNASGKRLVVNAIDDKIKDGDPIFWAIVSYLAKRLPGYASIKVSC